MLNNKLRFQSQIIPAFVPTDIPNCELWLDSTATGVVASNITHANSILSDYKATYVPDLSGNNRHAYTNVSGENGPLAYNISHSQISNTLRFKDPHFSTINKNLYMTGDMPYFASKTVVVVNRFVDDVNQAGYIPLFAEYDSLTSTYEYDRNGYPGYLAMCYDGSYGWKFRSLFYNPNYDYNSNICYLNLTNTLIQKNHKAYMAIVPSLSVNVPAMATAVKLSLSLTYSNLSDLKVTLISPTKKCVILNYQGGTGQNLLNATFSDSATQTFPNNQSNYSGTYLPYEPLNIFNGENTKLPWFIEIENASTVNSGTIDNAVVTINNTAESLSNIFPGKWNILIHLKDSATFSDTFENSIVGGESNYESVRKSDSTKAITNKYSICNIYDNNSVGDVSMVLYYSRVLSNTEKNKLITYINQRMTYTPTGSMGPSNYPYY